MNRHTSTVKMEDDFSHFMSKCTVLDHVEACEALGKK